MKMSGAGEHAHGVATACGVGLEEFHPVVAPAGEHIVEAVVVYVGDAHTPLALAGYADRGGPSL
jgi:hypothetical protein